MGDNIEFGFKKVLLQDDQFNGLVGNIPGNFIPNNSGGGGGIGFGSNVIGHGENRAQSHSAGPGGGYGEYNQPMAGGYAPNVGGFNQIGSGYGYAPNAINPPPPPPVGIGFNVGSGGGYNPPGYNPAGGYSIPGAYNPNTDGYGTYGNHQGSGYQPHQNQQIQETNAGIGEIISGIGGLLGGGGSHGSSHDGSRSRTNDIGNLIGGFIGGGGNDPGRSSQNDGRKQDKSGFNIGSLIGGFMGGQDNKYSGGGPRTQSRFLKGGLFEDMLGNLIGKAAHKYFGIDQATGKIIGAAAGNLIFHTGGKDNNLGSIGKKTLERIINGKFRKHTEPFVKPKPGTTSVPTRPTGAMQDFYAIRDECLRNRHLFEDPEFPANDSSLYYSRRPAKRCQWKRPGEIVRDPLLISEGHSRFDVVQGELGDCWLLAAAANLTLRDELFYRVVPPDQSFTDNYAGIFHFQFWQYGKWVDVIIDDRLPTSNGELLYMHSRDHREFWSALLEKAYAKMHGSYEALKGGTTSEALEDMTGGLTEFIDINNPPQNLMELMIRGIEMGSLFGCSIEADPHQWEARLSNGLIKGHAYSITGMRIINGPRGQVPLIRMRNPWGNEQEWNGPWSDNSSEWRYLSTEMKRNMGLQFAHDGEFWMSFDDFRRNFEKLEVCNLGPDVMTEITQMTGIQANQGGTWAVRSFDGSWRQGRTAGGCRNYLRTFAMNPQYHIRLRDSDPNDDDDLCTLIIGVLQKYRRELKSHGVETLAIGFALYEVRGGVRRKLDTDFFANTKSCGRSAAFINLREVTARFRVPPGDYVIVPSTYEPNEEADFMVRIFTNGFIDSSELN